MTGSEPENIDFTFTKEWLNLEGEIDATWPEDINVTLYSQKGKVADLTLSNQDGSSGDLTWTATTNPDGTVTFVIKDLPAKDGEDDLVYYVQEEQVDGYKAPKYAMIQSDGVIVIKPDSDATKDRANNDQAIVNNPEGGVELPSTGGTGTIMFYVLGGILLVGSLLTLAGRARSARS
ncbi:MAG: Cna B-type domain-containing protein [Clostridiales bacterium]|nr:Cna B-type domain-containing protein [Clostridiales bacterium]